MTSSDQAPHDEPARGSAAGEMLSRLPPLTVRGRLARLHERLGIIGVDAAAFVSAANVRWLTGFTGSNGTVVVKTAGEAALITDSRYREQAATQLADAGCREVEVIVTRDSATAAARWLQGATTTGLEDSVSWAEQRSWSAALAEVGENALGEEARLIAITQAVEALRAVKDNAELARIEAAADIADDVLAQHLHLLRPGITEMSMQRTLEDALRSAGADGPAYPTIVASGPNSALPHAEPTDRRMADGDLVIIDMGAAVDGYRSDMTRTFVLGDPHPEAQRLLDAVKRSQQEGVASLRPGVTAASVDAACRSTLEEAGLGDAFVHGTGHGIGLEVHELPAVGAGVETVIERGSVLTVEPGVYVVGFGGVRFEDLLVVVDGGSRNLTKHPKSPSLPRAA